MINSMHSDKTIGILGVEYHNLGTQFNHFQTYSIKITYQKNLTISARFRPIFDFELIGKGQEPCRAELKIPQLELWLEPVRLGLITTTYLPTSNFVQF